MNSRKNAFTLSEILISLTISGIAMAAVLTFFIMSLRSSAITTVRLDNNSSMKRCLDELFTEVRSAQRYEIFPSYASTASAIAVGGGSGDYVVLYYTTLNSSSSKIPSRRVGYYLDTTNPAVPRLIKHELTRGAGVTDTDLRTRPVSTSTPANRSEVAKLITKAGTTVGLFTPNSLSSFNFHAAFFPSNYVTGSGQAFQRSYIELTLAIRN